MDKVLEAVGRLHTEPGAPGVNTCCSMPKAETEPSAVPQYDGQALQPLRAIITVTSPLATIATMLLWLALLGILIWRWLDDSR